MFQEEPGTDETKDDLKHWIYLEGFSNKPIIDGGCVKPGYKTITENEN